MPARAILRVRSARTPGRSSTSTTTTSRSRVTARWEIPSKCFAAPACGTRMWSSACSPGPMHVAAAMFMPASLIAAAICASAPGVFSMSMTRSTAMCPPAMPAYAVTTPSRSLSEVRCSRRGYPWVAAASRETRYPARCCVLSGAASVHHDVTGRRRVGESLDSETVEAQHLAQGDRLARDDGMRQLVEGKHGATRQKRPKSLQTATRRLVEVEIEVRERDDRLGVGLQVRRERLRHIALHKLEATDVRQR